MKEVEFSIIHFYIYNSITYWDKIKFLYINIYYLFLFIYTDETNVLVYYR